MKTLTTFILITGASLSAQTTQVLFECQGALPYIWGAVGVPAVVPDCEGLTTNAPTDAAILGVPGCGMPVQGQAFLGFVGTDPPVAVPPGGPFPRPVVAGPTEVRIPMPTGTTAVSLSWEFYRTYVSGVPSPAPNDGIDVSVIDPATGLALATVVYADASTAPLAPGGCILMNSLSFQAVETGIDGPQFAAAAFAPTPPGAYHSAVSWRGTQGAGSWLTAGSLDAITFVGQTPFSLLFSSPSGPGSLQIDNVGGGPQSPYLSLLTLNQGAFPGGALGGIDILPAELAAQIAFGASPFVGVLDSAGASTFSVPPTPALSGLSIFGFSATLDPLSPAALQLAPATMITIP